MLKTDKYLNTTFESSSAKTPQFNAFARAFKADILASLPAGFELAKITNGHFYISGFIRRIATADNRPGGGRWGQLTNSFYYFSISDVRFFPLAWDKSILIRTAESVTDYTGGQNQSVSLAGLRAWLAVRV